MKRPKLVPDAKRVARHSWAFRLNIVGAALGAVELGMSVLTGNPPVSPTTFAAVYAAVNLAGAAARLVAQQAVSGEQA